MLGPWLSLSRTPEDISLAAQVACLLEVNAPKPGNVTREAGFTGTRFEDFLLSAAAIGPAFCRVGVDTVGQIIWNAVSATRRLVRTNTNLGIVLLLAPLAEAGAAPGNVRVNLAAILARLSVEDAQLTYAAIRLANAGGLGQAQQADVSGEPEIPLREAMTLARHRDAIASEYVTDFAVTFDVAFPALESACWATPRPAEAIVLAFLTLLARVPDTLIARKRGDEVARDVSGRAAAVLDRGSIFTDAGRMALAEFDRELRDEGHTLNPGTTADLVTAALFLKLIGWT
jgi:triphosphoribosyl-dephospho-CoA synthase